MVSYKTDSLHRFWKTNEHQEDFIPEQVEASMRERCIRFDTEFVPVTRKCGAPMPGDKRCERMDREKCPFHGKIVERDVDGKPIHKEDIERVTRFSFSLLNKVCFFFNYHIAIFIQLASKTIFCLSVKFNTSIYSACVG